MDQREELEREVRPQRRGPDPGPRLRVRHGGGVLVGRARRRTRGVRRLPDVQLVAGDRPEVGTNEGGPPGRASLMASLPSGPSVAQLPSETGPRRRIATIEPIPARATSSAVPAPIAASPRSKSFESAFG